MVAKLEEFDVVAFGLYGLNLSSFPVVLHWTKDSGRDFGMGI